MGNPPKNATPPPKELAGLIKGTMKTHLGGGFNPFEKY